MEELCSPAWTSKEHINKMKVTLHGMTSGGDIVVDCQYSDGSHTVLIYKLKDEKITPADELQMNSCATMTLMPTDDFVYSDTGNHTGLTSWNLPTNVCRASSQCYLLS